jgi:tol-pal system-associated acyl-CoA thioesterase
MPETQNTQVFEWPLRVYIEDTDAGGIVYYVNYLKFMERARTEFMRSMGFDKQFVFNNDVMFVVHSINSEYLKPARLDDELAVTVQVIRAGKATMIMRQLIYRMSASNDNNKRELICRAEVKVACVDQQTIKPKRMPDTLFTVISNNL